MKKIRTVIEKLLLYGFFILGIILLFYSPTGRTSTMVAAFVSFIFSIVIAWVFELKDINRKYLLYIYITIWLNMFGELFAYYDGGILLYDKFLHFTLGFLLSAVVLDYYQKNSNLKRDSVFLTVLGLMVIWEISEFSTDAFFGFRAQGVFINNLLIQSPLDDTMYDFIWGAIGSLAYLFFKKEKMDIALKKTIKKEEILFSTFLKKVLKW